MYFSWDDWLSRRDFFHDKGNLPYLDYVMKWLMCSLGLYLFWLAVILIRACANICNLSFNFMMVYLLTIAVIACTFLGLFVDIMGQMDRAWMVTFLPSLHAVYLGVRFHVFKFLLHLYSYSKMFSIIIYYLCSILTQVLASFLVPSANKMHMAMRQNSDEDGQIIGTTNHCKSFSFTILYTLNF